MSPAESAATPGEPGHEQDRVAATEAGGTSGGLAAPGATAPAGRQ